MVSRTARIYFLLVLDLIFFLLEIIIGSSASSFSHPTSLILSLGYAVGSLALVADSFHMLKYAPTHCPSLLWALIKFVHVLQRCS